MTNRKTSKKDASKGNSKRLLIVATSVVGVLIILWAGWWLIFKHNAYSPDKEAVMKGAMSLYNSISLPGDNVYSVFSDTGCDDSHAVGASTNVYCSFVGYKYFEADTPLSQNLRAADAKIQAMGWKRTFTSQDSSSIDYLLSDSNNQTASYVSPPSVPKMVASLGYYKSDTSKSDSYLQSLIRDGKISAPAEGKYIYGIRVGATYWSCSSTSIFKICPLPPSSPRPF